MTLITISDLTTADSFLNELKKTETTQIFGGWRGGGCYEKVEEPTCDNGSWEKEQCYEEEQYYKEEEEHCYYEEEKSYDNHYSGWKTGC